MLNLIENNLIPQDVKIQVLTQSREHLIDNSIAESELDEIDNEIEALIIDAIKKAKDAPFPENNILDFVFVNNQR